ncbi:DUF3445 domain-containing protein [Altererythrobacter sp.]|nr:DUF3445 domain-containing protein [Altererythrobacter sp.]
MSLGFSVDELLPRARGGGQLKMGLVSLSKQQWLDPDTDFAARETGFAEYSEGIQLADEGMAAGEELAAMLAVTGGLPGSAKAHHEDMCLLTRRPGEDAYRLVGAAVAWPTGWHPEEKMGLPLAAMHAPIQGYAEQLASGVDHFMSKLKPGKIFGRCNWFIAPTDARRWIAGDPRSEYAHVTADNAGQTLFARCERQTLRRLPETGAILFTIGIYVQPLDALATNSVRWLSRAAQAIPAGERERRGIGAYLPALMGYASSQEEE